MDADKAVVELDSEAVALLLTEVNAALEVVAELLHCHRYLDPGDADVILGLAVLPCPFSDATEHLQMDSLQHSVGEQLLPDHAAAFSPEARSQNGLFLGTIKGFPSAEGEKQGRSLILVDRCLAVEGSLSVHSGLVPDFAGTLGDEALADSIDLARSRVIVG